MKNRKRASRVTRIRLLCMGAAAIATVALPSIVAAQTFPKSTAPDPYAGQVGRTVATTHAPTWPGEPTAPKDAPNVLVIMTDDIGFGVSSVFGGPVPTPTLAALAKTGARYTRFNTTALCSPTRASLLTGRMPQNVNMGNVANLPTGFDGYTTVIPKTAGTMAEILKEHGFNTAMFGKGHLTPQWEQSMAGPFDRWPTGLGFQHFYGFISADTSQWEPSLVEDTTPIEPPHGDPKYFFEADMANHAIHWIEKQHAVAPSKPFFIYYAPGTAHAPNQAPKAWIAKFKGKFDQGWDVVRQQTFERQKAMGLVPKDAKISPRPASLPAWSSLDAEHKKVYARMMECYAAAVAYSDAQTGRVIDALRKEGELKNTLIVFIEGDNGSSAEGGPQGLAFEQSEITGHKETFKELASHYKDFGSRKTYNLYPAAWAWAMNAPFPWWKQIASQAGGVRNGMVISWPGHIKDPKVTRLQYAYVDDIMPTVLQATGVKAPKTLDGYVQKPIDGMSLAYTFQHPNAPSQRRTQIYEMMENYGIYRDGWMAGTLPKRMAWEVGVDGNRKLNVTPAERKWTLFDLKTDFTTAVDLSKKYPEKLKELKQLFWQQAARTNILPIHDWSQGTQDRPSMGAYRTHFVYPARMTRITEDAAPHTIGRSFTITADVVIPKGGAHGVLIDQGGRYSGYGFYLKDDKPVFYYNAVGTDQYAIRSKTAVPEGAHKLTMKFVADEQKPGTPGTATIYIDGKEVASGRIGRTMAGWVSHTEGLDIGSDTITPVSSDYTIENSSFTGKIKQVDVTLSRAGF